MMLRIVVPQKEMQMKLTLRNKLYLFMRHLLSFDYILIFSLVALFIVNVFVQYSANDQVMTRLYSDVVFFGFSFILMMIIASINTSRIRSMAIPLYIISIILIALVLVIGIRVNGARRWLNLGIRIQPSELCKLSVPLLVAYVLSIKDNVLTYKNYLLGFVLIIIPFLLIAKQPDLGTGILVFSAGFFVLFFAGLPWKIIISSVIAIVASSPLIWHLLKDYQKHRILTLLDPQSDPLGKGYHIIQGIIAIGSGGIYGKGYLHGSQVHLNFIPEKHTDFVITVLAEEFGYIGIIAILTLYLLIAMRGLRIMRLAPDRFSQTLAGSITMSFILYVLINMGMVSGIFPVVGVPLPLISYGGTATIVIMIGFGILLSIDHRNRYKDPFHYN
ncbi:MAG: rod shape-determining protein RodA [Proteobacteria bacterium]|nr:MAG: rod shape-determining protein RodA [Pseudomonadota bacterium]